MRVIFIWYIVVCEPQTSVRTIHKSNMKKISIIICIILLVLSITYTMLFIGSENYNTLSKQTIYNRHFHIINLPLVKCTKGFLSYTFYVKGAWDNDASNLSFEVNYRTGIVTFNNPEEWNIIIHSLNSAKPKLLKNQYNYFGLDHSFFNDIKSSMISYRLLEEGTMGRQLIILKSDAVVKISL